MAQTGAVSRAEAERAKHQPLALDARAVNHGCVSSAAPFFCSYLREWLLRDPALGDTQKAREQLLQTGGLTIRTTLDRRFQRAAVRAVHHHVHPRDRAIGALAMVEPGTGQVRAIAQSRPMGAHARRGQTFLNDVVPEEYDDSGGFQAGSTFKAVVLSAAIKQGIPLTTTIDSPPQVRFPVHRYRNCHGHLTSSDVWKPRNSTSSGPMDLYSGTRLSVNTFFAQLELRTGLCQPFRLAQRMGIQLDDPARQMVPSFTLGVVATNPLAMAGAYATFAARGMHCTPQPVTAIHDRTGRLLQQVHPDCTRVLGKAQADAVNKVLRGLQLPGGGSATRGAWR